MPLLVLVALASFSSCATRERVETAAYDVLFAPPAARGVDAWVKEYARGLDALDASFRAAYGVSLHRGAVDVDEDAFRGKAIGGYYNQITDTVVVPRLEDATLIHEVCHRYNHHVFGFALRSWVDESLAYTFMLDRDSVGPVVSIARCWDAIAAVRSAQAKRPALVDAGARDLFASSPFDTWLHGGRESDLRLSVARVLVSTLLRERLGKGSPESIRDVVAKLEKLGPDEIAAAVRATALADFSQGDALASLLEDPSLPSSLLHAFVARPIDLEDAARRVRDSAWGRRRLVLLVAEGGQTTSSEADERRFFEDLLKDQDVDVARAAVFALAKRGDARMVGPLARAIAAGDLRRSIRVWRTLGGGEGSSWEAVPLADTLGQLLRDLPKAPDAPEVPALDAALRR